MWPPKASFEIAETWARDAMVFDAGQRCQWGLILGPELTACRARAATHCAIHVHVAQRADAPQPSTRDESGLTGVHLRA